MSHLFFISPLASECNTFVGHSFQKQNSAIVPLWHGINLNGLCGRSRDETGRQSPLIAHCPSPHTPPPRQKSPCKTFVPLLIFENLAHNASGSKLKYLGYLPITRHNNRKAVVQRLEAWLPCCSSLPPLLFPRRHFAARPKRGKINNRHPTAYWEEQTCPCLPNAMPRRNS